MKKYLLFTLFTFLLSTFSIGQCSENEETKVLLVGDSWAFFMNVDGTFDNVFENWGHSNYKYYTNLTLAENGAETEDFLEPGKQGEIANQLISKPSIDYVHLSIGGNDVLGSWKSVSFTQAQTDSLKDQVKDSVVAVIDFIKSVRPDVKIIFSGYAYPNFEEVVNSFLIPSQHPFYGTWEGMEFPENQEINELLNSFSADVESHYANDPRVIYIKAAGITQYTFGQTDPLEVAPYGTYAPETVPLPLGDPAYPSPMNSMRNYQITKDCFHLSAQGFRDLIGYQTQKFYQKALMDDKYFIAQDAQTSSSVSSQGTVDTDLMVGESGGTSYSTILNFETAYNLDSIAEKASLFLHRIEQTGGNPIQNNSVLIEINEGGFGTTVAVESGDYSETGDASGNPCVFGANSDGNWVRLDLPSNLMDYISNYKVTQFKISAPSVSNSLVQFTGTSDTDFAPVLNIVYGNQSYAGVPSNNDLKNVYVYPNPTTGQLKIHAEPGLLEHVSVCSLDGRIVKESNASVLDISQLPSGAYFVNIQTIHGIVSRKVIKN